MRLNKWIADSGLCSRRQADRLIESGQVSINGEIVLTLGIQIDPKRDKVLVQNQPLPTARMGYIAFHKPKGVITTRWDEKARKTIYDVLPGQYQSYDPAGRLDRDSSGLLVLSNDGDFIHHLMHPSFHVPKVYEVKVASPLSKKALNHLIEGVHLLPEDKIATVVQLERIGPLHYVVTLATGYNRQIRRSFEAVNAEVKSLKRIQFGPVHLEDLPIGNFRPLTPQELKAIAK
ncbi:MAG: rRNA pseudouridine synthase [Cyanobacteria bacterium]|nr:rRNA pseudouridine synthase [Cyanobacteriota bacterium]